MMNQKTQLSSSAKRRNKSQAKKKVKVISNPSTQQPRVLRPPKRLTHDLYVQLAQQCALPGSVNTPLVMPNSFPAQVTARKFKRTVSVSKNDFPELYVLMSPDLFTPGYIGSKGTFQLPASGYALMQCNAGIISKGTEYKGTLKVEDMDHSRKGLLALEGIPDGDNTVRFGFRCDIPAGNTVTVTYRNVGLTNGGYTVYFLAPDGNWVAKVSSPVMAPQGQWTADVITAVDDVAAIGFLSTYDSEATHFKLNLMCTGSSILAGANTKGFAPAFGKQAIDDNISSGRVTAMSLLVENTSPLLNVTGSIAAARAPSHFDQTSNWADQIAPLPSNRQHIGKFKTGAYVTWLPSQFDECEVDSIGNMVENLSDAEMIVVSVTDWGESATALLTFEWIVEFYSPNAIFDKRLTPPRTEEWAMVYYSLLNMPAAGCNPSHLAAAAKYLNDLRNILSSSYESYQKYKPLLDSVGNAISTGYKLLAAF